MTKALLRWVGNPLSSSKANAGLTVPRKAGGADSKEGLTERWQLF